MLIEQYQYRTENEQPEHHGRAAPPFQLGPGGAVAIPVTWYELAGVERANAFNIFSAADRALGQDAWEGYFHAEQTLTQRIRDVIRNH